MRFRHRVRLWGILRYALLRDQEALSEHSARVFRSAYPESERTANQRANGEEVGIHCLYHQGGQPQEVGSVKRWYHIYVDDVFIETVESTLPMYVVMEQVTEIHSDYKTSIELSMMGGQEQTMCLFKRENN